MNEETLSTLIMCVFLFIFSVILTYQTIVKKRKTWFFTLAVYSSLALTIGETIRTLITEESLNLVLLTIALILWSLIFIFIYLFLQQLETDSIRPILTLFVFLFYFIEIIFGLLQLFEYPGKMRESFIIMWDFGYGALGVLIFAYGALIHWKIYRKLKDKEALIITIALLLMVSGFLWGFLGDLISFLSKIDVIKNTEQIDIFKNYLFVGDIIKAIGILIFSSVYVFRPNYIFKHPFRIDSIIIYNNIGLPIYGARYTLFKKEEKELAEKQLYHFELIGGAINALSEFITVTTGSKKKLAEIITGDKIIKIVSNDLCSVVVMSDKISFFLVESMKKTANEIEKRFGNELEEKHVEDEIFPEVRRIVKNNFPFLPEANFEYS